MNPRRRTYVEHSPRKTRSGVSDECWFVMATEESISDPYTVAIVFAEHVAEAISEWWQRSDLGPGTKRLLTPEPQR